MGAGLPVPPPQGPRRPMDDISAAFENLSIEDFIRETSAQTVTQLNLEERAVAVGRDNFNHFTNAQIQSCVDLLHESEFTAGSVLHNAEVDLYFQLLDNETAYYNLALHKRESKAFRGTW